MPALVEAPSASQRSVQVLVIGTSHAGVRAMRDVLRGDTRFHTNGARSTIEAVGLLERAVFDAVIIDARVWSDSANPVRRTLGRQPGVAIVVVGDTSHPPGEHRDARLVRIADGAPTEQLGNAIIEAMNSARELRRRDTMVRWLERESFTDALTGLHNARAFDEALRAACTPDRNASVGLVVLNVVGTSMVNHNYGQDAGDRMLRHAALGIGRCVRASDVAARLEGDTFAVLVDGADLEICRRIGRRIAQELSRANADEWSGDIPVAVTMALASGEGCEPGDLLKSARRQLGSHRPFMPAPPMASELDNGPSVA